ncbi:conserved hypothetical protein [Vibrio phage 495E54-1]|nr:conserved hypothetical protein [Vibrio phage 495E54-1]
MKWSEELPPNEKCRYNHVVYNCPILGDIFIEWKGWKEYDSYDCYVMTSQFEIVINVSESSLDEAKVSVEKQLREKLKEALQKVNEK